MSLIDSVGPDGDPLTGQVRNALAPVLKAMPYVLIVDATTLEQMNDNQCDLRVVTPHYQRDVMTTGLLESVRQMRTAEWGD